MALIFPESTPIDFFTWMEFGVPFVIVMILIIWTWLTRVAYKKMPNVLTNAKEALDKEVKELGPMSRGEKNTLFVFVLTAFC